MRLNPVVFSVAAAGLALATVFVHARQTPPRGPDPVDLRSADLISPQAKRGLTMSKATATADVTVEDVGDVDSFGRNLRWLGVTQMEARLSSDCTDWTGPGCQVLAPPGTFTTFAFNDLARIRLPPRATKSLLCYWVSPLVTVSYFNPTGSQVNATLRYSPTLTIENAVLNDPALINPMTGLPFAGSLQTSLTSTELYEVPLAAGTGFNERSRDSAVCIAGVLSKRALVDNYGLTEAQAASFFQQETMVRLNLAGATNYVTSASLIFGLRLIGD